MKRGCFGYFLRGILIILSVFLLIVVIFGFYSNARYKDLKLELSGQMIDENHFNFDNNEYEVYSNSLDVKIEKYTQSEEEVTFMELEIGEIAVLVNNTVKESLPFELKISEIYIDPSEGEYQVYLHLRKGDRYLPWVRVDVLKDTGETAELYFKEFWIGHLSMDDVGIDYFSDSVNDGYRDALYTVNENGFSGRRYENIELEEDGIIIKGRAL